MSKFKTNNLFLMFIGRSLALIIILILWLAFMMTVATTVYTFMLGLNLNMIVMLIYFSVLLPIEGIVAAFAFLSIRKRAQSVKEIVKMMTISKISKKD